MIVSTEEERFRDFKKQEIQELYYFLTLVNGNYRNSIYVECPHGIGYMLTTDDNARPVLFPAQKFYEITGEIPQKDEFIGRMSNHVFEAVYSKWLSWNTDFKDSCGICGMYKEQNEKIRKRRYKKTDEKK